MRAEYLAGAPILNWLYAGPFAVDVSELYTDNYAVDFNAYADFWERATQAMLGAGEARENEPFTLFGQAGAWKAVRVHEADTRLTWARFSTHATLLVTLAHTAIHVARAGAYALSLQGQGAYRLLINGELASEKRAVGRVDFSDECEVYLNEGVNSYDLMLFNVHLHCQNTCRLSLNAPVEAYTRLSPIPDELRARVERAFDGVYLSNAVALPGSKLFILNGGLPERGVMSYIMRSPAGDIVAEGAFAEDCTPLPDYGALPAPGDYTLQLEYRYADIAIEGPALSLKKFEFIPGVPDADIEGRKRFILDAFARLSPAYSRHSAVFHEIAKLASGNADLFEPNAIMDVLDYVNARYDCSDFAMHGILRFYIKYSDHPLVTPELKRRIKRCILGFKYWVDEPGRSLMFTRSENHEILFYSAEYVAGMLFPTEIFTNSGQNGLFHALKGRVLAERWIREKGYYGFTEWHSNTYYEEDMLALLSIWDFGEENGLLRQLALQLMHMICAFIASNSSHGVMATTHGRCYELALMHPFSEGVSRLNYVLFGEPRLLVNNLSIGAVALADGGYAPPAECARMQKEETLYTRSRMGLFRRECQAGVRCLTYRTRHYMVSGLVESKAGEHGAQVNAGQALLEGETPVFVTCFANRSPNTRPSYFGGQYRIPKTVAHKNVLAYAFHISEVPGYTHCYFPMDEMDEARFEGAWTLARKGGAYIGVYCSAPYTLTRGGSYGNRELITLSKQGVWLFELGDCAQYADFDAFCARVLASGVISDGASVRYMSPSQGEMCIDFFGPCSVNGEIVAIADMPLIENQFVRAEYGSGKLKFDSGRIMDFFA